MLFHFADWDDGVAISTRVQLQAVPWYIFEHLSYSPDLTLSDFHIFLELQKNWVVIVQG